MRVPLAVALAFALLVLMPVGHAAEDVRDPGKVGRILEVLVSPQVAPGESGDFEIVLTNPYLSPMRNATLTASIYFFATIEEGRPVDANWTYAYPRFANGTDATGRELALAYGTIPPGNLTERLTVETSSDMPHGSVFSQGAYFVRFRLVFDYDNGTGEREYTMSSPGHFEPTLWEQATNGTCLIGPCRGDIDLGLLGVDGVLPDSAFGVKEPIPIWPFWLLAGVMVFFLVLAFLYWVEDHPASFPRVERGWAVFRGRLRQIVPFRRPKPRG